MSILIVQHSPPYGNSNAKEALDIALAAGTFEQEVHILFMGDACYQLAENQNPHMLGQKSIPKMLTALPIYGIEEVLIDRASLDERSINTLCKDVKVKVLSSDEVKAAYRNAKTVLRF